MFDIKNIAAGGIAEAAKKNGLTRTALEYRIKNKICDPRGYLFDLERNVV